MANLDREELENRVSAIIGGAMVGGAVVNGEMVFGGARGNGSQKQNEALVVYSTPKTMTESEDLNRKDWGYFVDLDPDKYKYDSTLIGKTSYNLKHVDVEKCGLRQFAVDEWDAKAINDVNQLVLGYMSRDADYVANLKVRIDALKDTIKHSKLHYPSGLNNYLDYLVDKARDYNNEKNSREMATEKELQMA